MGEATPTVARAAGGDASLWHGEHSLLHVRAPGGEVGLKPSPSSPETFAAESEEKKASLSLEKALTTLHRPKKCRPPP